MPKTVNELLQELSVSHTVNVQQLTAGVVQRMIATLGKADKDLLAQLQAALAREPQATTFSVNRLDNLLLEVRAVNRDAYQTMAQAFDGELQAFNKYEVQYQTKLLDTVIPPSVATAAGFSTTTVVPEQVYAAAMSRPFQGRLLREWMSDLEEGQATRIRDAVRMGFTEGESIDQVIRRVRGTRAAGYQDGILQIGRREAEAVIRTAMSHVANTARDDLFTSNDSVIKAVVWHSTLDMRTSSGCQIRDNKQYDPVTHKPLNHSIPWAGGPGRLHWRCRSTSYPLTKSWEELGIKADELDAGTRASMDGQVPEDLSYGAWLQKQPAWRQDEILGPSRGQLMRSGGLAFDSFYTNRGELLSLDQLRAREAAAFKRAGLD